MVAVLLLTISPHHATPAPLSSTTVHLKHRREGPRSSTPGQFKIGRVTLDRPKVTYQHPHGDTDMGCSLPQELRAGMNVCWQGSQDEGGGTKCSLRNSGRRELHRHNDPAAEGGEVSRPSYSGCPLQSPLTASALDIRTPHTSGPASVLP